VDNSLSVPVDAAREDARQAVEGVVGPGSSVGEAFTAQEQAFLRHYSEGKLRYEAMVQAGYVASAPDRQGYHGVMERAQELVGRAERLSLSSISSAIGADKVLFCSYLWQICTGPKPHEAIKGLQLLARIHGLWDNDKSRQPQVALVFTSAQSSTPEKPVDLPFTMSSADYSVFSDPRQPPQVENDRAS
jgi:hypothetical protein